MAPNCWEFKKCGREPHGKCVATLGVCPASTEVKANGLNHGRNGGRICWALTGTLCGGTVQGSLAQKITGCMNCDFYATVRTAEGKDLQSLAALQARH